MKKQKQKTPFIIIIAIIICMISSTILFNNIVTEYKEKTYIDCMEYIKTYNEKQEKTYTVDETIKYNKCIKEIEKIKNKNKKEKIIESIQNIIYGSMIGLFIFFLFFTIVII